MKGNVELLSVVKLVAFVIVSIPILWISRTSLRNPRAHGFYRFYAFEAILLLLLTNADVWFLHPLSPHQWASWILLAVSLFLAVHGFRLLRIIGKPQGDFENTTRLVVVGAYKYIRHPLYSSLLFLAWGAFLKEISLLCTLLVLVASVFLYATAKTEESENLARFGEAYAAYSASTKMFIPFIL